MIERGAPPALPGPLGALRRALHNTVGTLLLYTGLVILGLMLWGGTALTWLAIRRLSPVRRQQLARRMIMNTFNRFLRTMQAMGLMKLDLSALDTLRGEALILAPNHPCLLDAVLVISRLPDVVCVMKAELMDNVFLGVGARMAGFIRNDSARSMVRQAIDAVGTGGQLLVFPEGTRTVRPPVNALKGAFALIARRARVPVQMIVIETNSPFLGKGWPLWKRPEFPLSYRIRLGPRVMPDDTGSVDELIEHVAGLFMRELAPVPSRGAGTPGTAVGGAGAGGAAAAGAVPGRADAGSCPGEGGEALAGGDERRAALREGRRSASRSDA